MASDFEIGRATPRSEDIRLITGRGSFVDDVVLPRMAHGHVLRSDHAHARIRSVNADAARAAPGVLCVLTGKEWRESRWGDLPAASGFQRRDGSPLYQPRCPALNEDRVRWVGDYIAFVVAETPDLARDAAELIEVDYEPLPVVVGTGEALEEDAPLVWDDCPSNICFVHLMGDRQATDAAFTRADKVVETRIVINRVTAASMEPRGCVGDYDAARDHYTVHTAVQRAFGYRSSLAKQVLHVPESKVRIIAGDIGGSFGMKTPIYNEAPLTLLASRLIGRPVKWTSSRSEAFLSDAQGRDKVIDAELALDRDGTFLGVRLKVVGAVGAYLQPGMPNFCNNMNSVAGVYRTPAIYAEVTGVFTHTNPVRAYRGNGRPEAAYIMERLIDLAADEHDFDPAELRRRNYIPTEAMPFKTALAFTYDCGAFERSMDMTMALAEAGGFEARRREALARGKLRGLGMSNTIERAAQGSEAAEIRIAPSGEVTLLAGSINHGQGHETIFKQILCGVLGVDPTDVEYVQGDTEKVAAGDGTGGSRTATVGGSAVLMASEAIVTKARQIAAHVLGLNVDDVTFREGVLSSPLSNRTITIAEAAALAADHSNLPDGMAPGLAAAGEYNTSVANFPNGCHICEVEIDPETGATEIVRYSVVDDVGTILNPLLLGGQIQGGIVQGIGQVLMEDIRFDEAGQLLTGSFMDYAMPRAAQLCAIEIGSNPVPTKTNPLGVKGAGEAGTIGAMPAVANAVVDALSPLGVRDIEMPATPERVWRAIRNAPGSNKPVD